MHNAVAADCPAVSNGSVFKCVPSSTDVLITKTDIITTVSTDYILFPAQIACDVTYQDLTQLLWETSLIWVAAFAIAIIYKKVVL